MSHGKHAAAEAVARRRGLGLAPDRGESEQGFAKRVLDLVAEQVIDLVNGSIRDMAEDLYYGLNPHRDAQAMRTSVGNLVSLLKDATALLDILPNDELISP